MTAPLLIIAAGGTAGHMYPAQALAEQMLERGWRIKLSTDARGALYTQSFPKEVEVIVAASATFARGGLIAKTMVLPKILAGTLVSGAAMCFDRPTLVAGFGGYPAIPAMAAAKLLRIPTLIHEQNGVLGRVNQVFARWVDAVACGTWPTELPKGVVGTDIGNPVRAVILDKTGAPYPDMSDGPLKLLAFGGSQGARIVAHLVPAAVALLPRAIKERLHVACQARPADQDACVAALSDVSSEVKPFFDDMPDRLEKAHLVVARSGASSVADIATIGRPSILIPLASAIRDEQTANARGLADAGAAVVVQEVNLTPESLASHIETILSEASRAAQMAAAALSRSKPDAARNLADLVERLAGGRA